jgi:hypothetical protein
MKVSIYYLCLSWAKQSGSLLVVEFAAVRFWSFGMVCGVPPLCQRRFAIQPPN